MAKAPYQPNAEAWEAVKELATPAPTMIEKRILTFDCEGMREIEPGRFMLGDVEIRDVDYAAVTNIVEASGLSRHEAEMMTEEFAEMIQTRVMAQQLAKRIKRVSF